MRLEKRSVFLLVLGIVLFSSVISASVTKECSVEITIEEVGSVIVYDGGAGVPDCTGGAFEGCPEDWTMENFQGYTAGVGGYSCAVARVDSGELPAYCEFTCRKTYITACDVDCDPCGGVGPLTCEFGIQGKLVSCFEGLLSESVYEACNVPGDPCAETPEALDCDDRFDNDCDGAIDCDDTDCSEDPYCAESFCSSYTGACDGESELECCFEQSLECISQECVCPDGFEWDSDAFGGEGACVELEESVCGDEILESPEECDDGCLVGVANVCEDVDNGDGCSSTCQLEEEALECDFTSESASWGVSEVDEGVEVTLTIRGTNCDDGEDVNFYIGETDCVLGINCDYERRDQTDTDGLTTQFPIQGSFSGGSATIYWAAEWIEDTGGVNNNPEYVFMAELVSDAGVNIDDSGKLKVNYVGPRLDFCDGITICMNYAEESYCNLDGCNVDEASVPGTVDCDDTDITCICSWNSVDGACDAGWGGSVNNNDIGTCTYVQTTDDDCDDGFLSFSWTETWEWDTDCDLTCQAQAESLAMKAKCQPGSNIIECPASIPIPFFEWQNLIISLVIIGLIYWAWTVKKNPSKKKK